MNTFYENVKCIKRSFTSHGIFTDCTVPSVLLGKQVMQVPLLPLSILTKQVGRVLNKFAKREKE